LAPRFFGPFPIIGKVGVVSYKLQLPDATKIHPVFHISQIKKVVRDYDVESSLPFELEDELDEIEEPEAILAARVSHQGRSLEDTTWKDEALLPDISLKDKVVVSGGNDRTSRHQQDAYGSNILEKTERLII